MVAYELFGFIVFVVFVAFVGFTVLGSRDNNGCSGV